MALGADRSRVFALVIREGMWLVGIGIAIGLAGGLYASESIKRSCSTSARATSRRS